MFYFEIAFSSPNLKQTIYYVKNFALWFLSHFSLTSLLAMFPSTVLQFSQILAVLILRGQETNLKKQMLKKIFKDLILVNSCKLCHWLMTMASGFPSWFMCSVRPYGERNGLQAAEGQGVNTRASSCEITSKFRK